MSQVGWRALAQHYRSLTDDELDNVGVQAVRMLRYADDEAAWEWFAKAVQRGLVYTDMRDHIEAILTASDEPATGPAATDGPGSPESSEIRPDF